MNPFVALLDVRGWLEAGDAWARLALVCAGRARACWVQAGEETDRAKCAIAEVTAAVREGRSQDFDAEQRDVELWERIETELERARRAA